MTGKSNTPNEPPAADPSPQQQSPDKNGDADTFANIEPDDGTSFANINPDE